MVQKKEYTCVLVETDDEGITWITFNRPEKRNAMSPTLHVEMEEILFGLETDEDTKVIVLTGAGNSWSAGMDLKQYFRETDKDPVARFRAATAHRRWATELLTWSRKPSIAMVNGYCYGGAFVSLAACDIVIAADNATFGLSEVNWGIIPGGNVSKVFGDMVSYRNALFYAMTGRTIDGRKAVELGIATLVRSAGQAARGNRDRGARADGEEPDGTGLHQTSDPRRARHGYGSSLRISGREEHGAARRRSGTDPGTRHARIPRREKISSRPGAGEAAVE